MSRTLAALALTLCASAWSLNAQIPPVENPGFETSSAAAIPGWTVRTSSAPGSHAAIDIATGRNMFRWRGKTYGEADDGLFVAMPNPFNPARAVYLFIGNSALEMYQMTKRFQGLPSWGIWKGDQVAERGYLPVESMAVGLNRGN